MSSNQYCGCDQNSQGQNCITSGQICSSGGCATTCSGSTSLCKGSCIDKSATHVKSCNDTSITCETNYEDVDGTVTNGCEVNLLTDNNHCGTKNNKCTNGRTCSNGTCSCPNSLTYCKTGDSTFACIDAANSNQYCGCSDTSVGINCISLGQICSSSSCKTQCISTQVLCNGECYPKSVLNNYHRISDQTEGTLCACKPGYTEPETPMDPCIEASSSACTANTDCTTPATPYCNPNTHACEACPTHSTWNNSTNLCECPLGSHMSTENNSCICDNDYTDCSVSGTFKCLKRGSGWGSGSSGNATWTSSCAEKCVSCENGQTCNRTGNSSNYAYTCN